jgi:putative SOS response-associated peptidase YedK
MHWGLIPFWAKDTSGASRMINARAETAATKPSFRAAFKKRRCLIPADGFYEWTGEKGRKQPWYLGLPNGQPFAFAGLYEFWKDKQGVDSDRIHTSVTILTTAASQSVRKIHHRMPVILAPDTYENWLDPGLQDPETVNQMLNAGHVTELDSHPVSKMVNQVRNNSPECIKPID